MSVLAAAADIGLVFLLLAVLAFGVSIYLAYVHQYVGAIVAAVIGVVILIVSV